MVNFFSSYKLNMLCISTTLIAFTANCILMPTFGHANQHNHTNLNSALVLARIKTLVDKLQNLSNTAKLSEIIDIVISVKHEVEIATNKKISLDEYLQKIQSNIAEEQVYHIPDSVINSYKKKLKTKEEKVKHHANYVAYVFSDPLFEYNEDEENFLFEVKHGATQPETDNITVPVDVAIGISISLCGVFLICCSTIFPAAFIYGEKLVEIGGVMTLTAGAQHYMKNNPQ